MSTAKHRLGNIDLLSLSEKLGLVNQHMLGGGEPEAPESRWERVDRRKNQKRLIDDCRVMIVDF
jgi:hypothetical protein